MHTFKGFAAATLATSLLIAAPAQAGARDDAEKVRKLDIMLMVTGLRCRTTADNFQEEYGRFTSNHLATLNAASNELKADMAQRLGPLAANRALDKLSVTMANQYGQGHPWLGCAALKQVAADLADARGAAPLVAAADELLSPVAGSAWAMARR